MIFLSSTYADLREERNAVTLAVLGARHIPSGMESFPATDDRGWQTIKRAIEMADYYVLLLAGRYGSIDATTGMGWAEREYMFAREKNVPVLGFIREKAYVTMDKTDEGADGRERAVKLAAFIATVREAHMVKDWRNAADLCGHVTQAMAQHIEMDEDNGTARPGWYRGTDMPSGEVASELARLSAENASLKEKLASQRSPPRALEQLRKMAVNTKLQVSAPYRNGSSAGGDCRFESIEEDKNALVTSTSGTLVRWPLDKVDAVYPSSDGWHVTFVPYR